MNSGLRFRKADINDIDAIDSIYSRALDAEEAGLTTTGWVRGIYPKREVAEASLQRGDMYVAEYDGRIAASGIINKTQVNVYLECDWEYKAPDEKICVLHTLVVDPDARGMGIGPAFVRFYEETGKDWGCEVLRIDTNARNRIARKMYAGLGYIETDIIPTVFNGIRNVDLVLMEKKIER
jgi:GNAT superfamily N-acetyltransferase